MYKSGKAFQIYQITQEGWPTWEIPLSDLWLFPCAHELLVEGINTFLDKEF